MASPQESITTVNGRRCTRSRARTAAASIFSSPQPPAVTTTQQAAASAPVQIAPNILTSAAAQVDPPAQAPPSSQAPPPAQAPPPSSNVPAERPAAAPTTPVAAVSSATGTSRAVSIPSTRPSLLANIVPSPPASAAPVAPVAPEVPAASAAPAVPAAPIAPEVPLEASTTPAAIVAVSQVLGRSSSAILEIATSIRSDTIPAGAPSAPPAESSLPAPVFASQVESAQLIPTSAAAPEQPNQTPTNPDTSSANIPLAEAPRPTTTAVTTLPSGDSSAGIIAPGQGPNSDESGLTIPTNGNPNIGSIVGGVVGGVAGLALVCALLFFCLRKRKTTEPRWLEKPSDGPTFMEKIKAIPSGITAAVAKMKGDKQGQERSSYRRHAPQDSISSVYSNDGRSRSMSEPQGLYAGAARPSSRSSRISKKGDRNVLRKKNSSVSSQSTFAGIMAELDRDPFADPEPPRTLLLLNPDPNQSPRGPVTPQPAATSAAMTTNPFSSPFDDENIIDPYLSRPPPLGHRRTGSSASALSSNPPEFFTPAPLNATNSIGPPPPTQAALPSQNRRSSMAFPAFNATSTTDSRESFYGEPGPSRPGTNLFTPGLPTGRTVRQSDPFDLDRPEVLGFGAVGRREVRASVTRQGTINRRMSSAGNWATTTADSQGTQRDSSIPRPLWSAGVRR